MLRQKQHSEHAIGQAVCWSTTEAACERSNMKRRQSMHLSVASCAALAAAAVLSSAACAALQHHCKHWRHPLPLMQAILLSTLENKKGEKVAAVYNFITANTGLNRLLDGNL